MKKWDRVSFILSLADSKRTFFSADLTYLEALVLFNAEHQDEKNIERCEQAVRMALKVDPLHQESLVLLASLHLKNPVLMPATEAETLLANAM